MLKVDTVCDLREALQTTESPRREHIRNESHAQSQCIDIEDQQEKGGRKSRVDVTWSGKLPPQEKD